MTSTPTASSERTRLCAHVMPVAGSTAGEAGVDGRSVVSTPARDAAASRVADSSGVVVLIAGFSWRAVRCGRVCGAGGSEGPSRVDGANKKPLVPQARRVSASVGRTDALGDYEELAGNAHPHTVRPPGRRRQPSRPTQW